MRLTLELLFAICTVLAVSRAETTPSTLQANLSPEEDSEVPYNQFLNPLEACKPYNNNTAVLCERTKFNADEAVPFNHPVKEVYFEQINGSIGVKTLSPFQDAELLLIRMSNIVHFEKGALCSLPKLKRLVVEYSTSPPLTKEILSGCANIEVFSTNNRIVEGNALHEMTNLKKLTLKNIRAYNFSKAYIEPLNKLEYLSVSGTDESVNVEQVEPGMFCTSPDLKTLKLSTNPETYKFPMDLPVPLRDTLFENCDSVKSVYISVHNSIPDRENPVRSIPHLEELHIFGPTINRLTKSFIDAVPNLKVLSVICASIDGDVFANATHLQELSIDLLEKSGLKAIEQAVNLEVLHLSGVYGGATVIEILPQLKNLRRLDLSESHISELDLPALKQKLPNLKEIDINYRRLDSGFKEEIEKQQDLKVTNTYQNIDTRLGANPHIHKTADGEPLIPYIPNETTATV